MKAQDLQHSGDLYLPSDPDIAKAQLAAQELQYDFNQTRPSEGKKRQELLQKMFAEIGEHTYIEPPLHVNFGAKFAHFGDYIYANYNLTMVDDTAVYVGDRTMFGPNVILVSHRNPPGGSRTAGQGNAIQPADPHRNQLLDRRRFNCPTGRHDW